MHTHNSTRSRHFLRWALLGLLVLVVALLIAGCTPGGGGKPLTNSQFAQLGPQMIEIEQITTRDALENRKDELKARARRTEDKLELGEIYFQLGYLTEYGETITQANPDLRDYGEARGYYDRASKTGTGYGQQALYRLGVLGALGLLDGREDSVKTAKSSLRLLETRFDQQLWVRQAEPTATPAITAESVAGVGGAATLEEPPTATAEGPVLQPQEMAATALRQLDMVFRTGGGLDGAYYRAVDLFVGFFKAIWPAGGVVLALFFLALVIKIVTAPLTTMAYRGMRDMQRVQPMLKELQEKYKDDRAKLAEEQMKLMKEHKVSPAGGCLPMLIQLPIFIVVYQAVLVYAYEFSSAGFLWIGNLARPDLILLILYAISMIVTQKLTTMPSADPQQQALQNQMTYMMPIFLVFVLSSIASAFVLYWFFLNVLSSAHQYYLMRKFQREEAAKAAAAPPAPPAPEPPASRRKKGNR